MPKRSKVGKVIQRSAGERRATTALDRARLRETMRRPVRTDDIRELIGTEAPVLRDEFGNLPVRRLGPVRRAILESLDAHAMTRYELWKKARAHCATLSRSAVYEYLRGARDIGVEYAEALMIAANLESRRTTADRTERTERGAIERLGAWFAGSSGKSRRSNCDSRPLRRDSSRISLDQGTQNRIGGHGSGDTQDWIGGHHT